MEKHTKMGDLQVIDNENKGTSYAIDIQYDVDQYNGNYLLA